MADFQRLKSVPVFSLANPVSTAYKPRGASRHDMIHTGIVERDKMYSYYLMDEVLK